MQSKKEQELRTQAATVQESRAAAPSPNADGIMTEPEHNNETDAIFSALFDREDPRYLALFEFVFGDWNNSLSEKAFVDFDTFLDERNQGLILTIAREKELQMLTKRALLDAISTYAETIRLIWIFQHSGVSADAKKWIERCADSSGLEQIRRIELQIKRNKKDDTLLRALHSIVFRSFDVSCWLLPVANLEQLGIDALEIVADCQRLVNDNTPDVDRKGNAADRIDEFVWKLETIVEQEEIELQNDQTTAEEYDETGRRCPPCPKNITLATHERLFLIAVELTTELTHWQNGQLRERYLRKHGEAIDTAFAKSWLNKASRGAEGSRLLLRRGKRRNTDYAVVPKWMPKPEI